MAFRLLAILLCLSMFPSLAGGQNSSGPALGTVIKDFELSDQHGKIQKLSQLLSKGPAALVVTRSVGWCTQSKEQLIDLQSELESLQKSGLQVIGLSYDRMDVLKYFAEGNEIEFPLLADPEKQSDPAAWNP